MINICIHKNKKIPFVCLLGRTLSCILEGSLDNGVFRVLKFRVVLGVCVCRAKGRTTLEVCFYGVKGVELLTGLMGGKL